MPTKLLRIPSKALYHFIFCPTVRFMYNMSAGFNCLVKNVPVCHSVIETVRDLCLQMLGRGNNGSLIDVKTLIEFLREAAVKRFGRRLCWRYHTDQ